MTYKECLSEIMKDLAKDDKVRFIGYNTRYGHQFNGTLKECEKSSIEMPVAENLILGVAMGMSLEGYKPIVCIERMDFLWACADALINHLDKAKRLGWPSLGVIIRTCVGNDVPLDPGIQHKADYCDIMKQLLEEVMVYEAHTKEELKRIYSGVLDLCNPVMIVEYRKYYDLMI